MKVMAERSDGPDTTAARDDRETLLEIARQITGKMPACETDDTGAPDEDAPPADNSHFNGADRSFRDSPSGMAICAEGRILRANPSFALAFGYPSPEALIAAGGLAAIFPADRQAIDPATVNGGTRRLLNATTRSRRRVKMPVALHAVTGEEDGPAILIVLHPGGGDGHSIREAEREPARPRVVPDPEPDSVIETAPAAIETPATTQQTGPALPEELPEPAESQGPADASAATPDIAGSAAESERPASGVKDKARSVAEAEFLARVSHDIRTPLNSIIGFAQLMTSEQAGPLGNERYRAYAGDILESGEYALKLIDDLLIISRIEAGTFELNFASVDLNELIGECVSAVHGEAHKRRVFLRASLGDASPLVLADRPTLERIVLNLLNNAVTGSHPGGQVIVEYRTKPSGAVQIRVQDNGSGMSDAEIAQALQPLVQCDTAPRPQFGNGLALPLTKALAKANRAKFRLESELGCGTRIAITFPSQRTVSRPA